MKTGMLMMAVMAGLAGVVLAGNGNVQKAPPEMQVATRSQEFSAALYGKLGQTPGNLFFSPYSISAALAMTSEGARGQTQEQMLRVLFGGLPQQEVNEGFKALDKGIETAAGKTGNRLEVANSLWPQDTHPFRPAYVDAVKTYYRSSVTSVNYKVSPDQVGERINAWVEEKTQKKIQNLIPKGTLTPLTRMVLVNAVYFKGTWAQEFEKDATRPEPFWKNGTEQAEVPMMSKAAFFPYAEMGDVQVLKMPYKGNRLSMVVVLPRERNGLPAVEKGLSGKQIAAWVAAVRGREVQVTLPKFKLTGQFGLSDTLQAMGVKDAFGSSADFSGMDGSRDLFISAVLHKAYVDVNEEGTEAAAATGVVMAVKAMPMPAEPPAVFRADHPFLFLIVEESTGAVLFMGRMAEPNP